MMQGCNKCVKMGGLLMLVLGVLFLLRDLNIWDFWNIQWWTALFLLWGLGSYCMSQCKDCGAMCTSKKK